MVRSATRLSKEPSEAAAIEEPPSSPRATLLLDTDVHPGTETEDVLSRLDKRWRDRFEEYGVRNPSQATYPRVRNSGGRLDSRPDGTPGSSLALTRSQLLDEYGEDFAILLPLGASTYSGTTPEFAAALCSAVNDSIREGWLDQDSRFRSTINVPLEAPDLAVAEIERCAGDPRFVQVLGSPNTEAQLGDRKYWPIYRAAAEAGLPLAVHTGGFDAHHNGTGWPSYYLEYHIAWRASMAELVLSMITEGVFQAIPDLQVVLVEGCITWAGPLQWTMDSVRKVAGGEIAHLERKPSEYFRDHFWFTTQPLEEPDDSRHLVQALEFTQMTDRIMFSSDYPHWDFDSPTRTLPVSMPRAMRENIMGANACRLYRLGPAQREGA
jgi:predicted TIM-barrel fold metal-dependent hydrolase